MNTKGMKFLAVLAVLSMAFAAVAIVAPLQGDDAAEYETVDVQDLIDEDFADVSEIDGTSAAYYFYESATVKVTALAAATKIYVNNGASVTLKFGSASTVDDYKVTVVTVAGDRNAKAIFSKTSIAFTPVLKSTFEYNAAVITEGKYVSGVWTSPYLSSNATFYSSDVLALSEATGAKLDVATGEEVQIVTDAVGNIPAYANFGYGMVYYTISDETYYANFTASGDSLSKVDLTSSELDVVKGTATATYGTASVVLSGLTSAKGTIVAPSDSANTIDLTLTFTSSSAVGTITLNGNVNLIVTDNDYDIPAGVTIVVTKNATVTATAQFTNNGIVVLKNKTGIALDGDDAIMNSSTGVVIAENEYLWDDTGLAISTVDAEGTGLVDTSAISRVLGVSGGEIETLVVAENQTITLQNDTTVTGLLKIYGILNVNPGVTLTISEGAYLLVSGPYAKVNNEGTISVKTDVDTELSDVEAAIDVEDNATFINDGSITASTKKADAILNMAIYVASDKFVNDGSINLGRYDSAYFSLFTNTGSMTLNGSISGSFYNSADITVGSAVLFDDLTITAMAKGATVKITQLEISAAAALKVVAGFSSTSVTDSGATVEFSAGTLTDSFKLKAVTITAATTYILPYTYNALDISGSMGVTIAANDVTAGNQAAVILTGNVLVNGTFSIPATAYLYVGVSDNDVVTAGVLEVLGEMTVLKNAGFAVSEDSKVNVTGKLIQNGQTVTPTTGVLYDASTTSTVITDFATALTEAIVAEDTEIVVYGYNYVVGQIEIPKEMYVSGEGTLDLSGTIEVDPEASLGVDVVVTSGILHSTLTSAISDTVTANVHIIADDEEEVTYMDLLTAIDVIDGTVTLYDEESVTVYSDLTIPAGVTLDARAGTLLIYGCTLTVEGRLVVDAEYDDGGFGVKDSYVALAGMEVDGYYMMETIQIGDDSWWYPAGVLYQTQDEEETTYYVITSVSNMSTAISENTGDVIEITANTKIDDLIIAGSAANVVTVVFDGDIDAGTITLSYATIEMASNKIVKATFAGADGYIYIADAQANNLIISDYAGLTATGKLNDILVETATAGQYTAETAYTLIFGGNVEIAGFTAEWEGEGVTYDDDDVDAPDIEMIGALLVSGKAVTFETGIIVYGQLIADNSSKIIVEGDVQLLGDLIAVEKTSSAAAGSISISGDLFVGALEEDMFATGTGASMSGDIAFDGTAYVLTGNVIDEAIVEDMNFLEIALSDVVFITLYSDNDTVTFEDLAVPVVDAVINDIVDENGDTVVSEKLSFSVADNTITANAYEISKIDYINVVVNEYIYTVAIKTDAGVKSVSLNGMVMLSSPAMTGENFFFLENLAAGTYTVSYTLKAGYEGTPTLSTEMGTVLKGYDIAIGGDYDEQTIEELDVDVIYQLTGTQKEVTPEPEPVTPEEKSEWTITTILLCILVVLIAIMAVIVALRLNRN